MNIDELKLILETLQHTTDGAKDFGVWWIALHYGAKVLESLLVAACVLGIAWGVYKAILISSGSSDAERRLEGLRDAMGIGTPGILTDDEYHRMCIKIGDWLRGENK